MTARSILIVDDDDDLRQTLAEQLSLHEEFTAKHYHAPSDEYDPKWDWRGAVQDVQLLYTIGRQVADAKDWPVWYPTAEFKAVRDASGAMRK